jgi:hypothetical protein
MGNLMFLVGNFPNALWQYPSELEGIEMQERVSQNRMRGAPLVLMILLSLITVLSASRPARAGPCGMVVTPTGDEFWPCPNQSSSPQAPPKPDVWGAVAVSPTTLIWGNSWNYKSKEDAAAQALQHCRAIGGGNDCKVVLKVADVCVALAVSQSEKLYLIGGPTGATNFAAANAMLKCQKAGGRNCTVATSFCADGVKHVLEGHTEFSNGNPVFVPSGQSTNLRQVR